MSPQVTLTFNVDVTAADTAFSLDCGGTPIRPYTRRCHSHTQSQR